jgi:hypothetical protein
MPNLTSVLKQLKDERARLDLAINAIEGLNPNGSKPSRATGTRQMSAAGRRRIALAQKKRWAAFRKARKAA